jgi:hypothetical protein
MGWGRFVTLKFTAEASKAPITGVFETPTCIILDLIVNLIFRVDFLNESNVSFANVARCGI